MLVFPNAKINIGLYITAKRPDGYHDIVTAMIPTDWRDILEIVPAKGTETTLTVTGRHVDCPPEKNLVMKAYRAMKEMYNLPAVDIYLHKVIPDGAGLGGGSADAAFTLRVLNDMFNLDLSTERLATIASRLGSDCPFFIYNRPMLATGTGTDLSPFDVNLSGYNLLIIKPDVHVSTAEAYGGCQPEAMKIDLTAILSTVPPEEWSVAGITNDFEKSVFPAHPAIERLKADIAEMGAVYTSMSGSGASVFGIFDRDILADEVEERFPGMAYHITKF